MPRTAFLMLSSTWSMSGVSSTSAGVSHLRCGPVVGSVCSFLFSPTTSHHAWMMPRERAMKPRVYVSRHCSLPLTPSSLRQHNVSHPFAALRSYFRATGYFSPWITFCTLAHLQFGSTYRRTGMQAKLTSFAQRSCLHVLSVRQCLRMGHQSSR